MSIQVFDIDYDLREDPSTKDFKELYNEEAVNQSIDIWITTPYRIGKGYSNALLGKIFMDLNVKSEVDIQRDIEEEIRQNYQLLDIQSVTVISDPIKRLLNVSMSWSIKGYPLSGRYIRYWRT